MKKILGLVVMLGFFALPLYASDNSSDNITIPNIFSYERMDVFRFNSAALIVTRDGSEGVGTIFRRRADRTAQR